MRFLPALVLILAACSPAVTLRSQLSDSEKKHQDHVGFVLYEPATGKTILDYQGDKYFTPASNTKIFTFYTALRILGDSIPAFRYITLHDSLIFWGLGDPSFLYKESFTNSRTFDFLHNSPQRGLYLSSSNLHSERFGPGWAWDDYRYYYSAERSAWPIYGNLAEVSVRYDGLWTVMPASLVANIVVGDSVRDATDVIRDPDSNQIVIHPGVRRARNHWTTPFQSTPDLIADLLSDTLARKVQEVSLPLPDSARTFYSVPSDSLYKLMMQESDNFVAEQLLLACAAKISDSLRTEIAIRQSIKEFLSDLPDKPIWVDGSGLSRYNLFTPRSIVSLWGKIYALVPRQRLFSLLPAGGKNGTLKNSYASEPPYLYGKTGSLSNNHTLSGFLLTSKGKVLIFSFMNANFVDSTRDIRADMQDILTFIRNNY